MSNKLGVRRTSRMLPHEQPCNIRSLQEERARTTPLTISPRHLILLVLLSFAVYANSLFMGKVWDDAENLRIVISGTADIKKMFTGDVFSFSGNTNFTVPYYRPLFMLLLAMNKWLWGESAVGYHLVNVLLHVLATSMAYLLAARIFRDRYIAVASGLIFAVHPVHAEAISWISAGNEPLCAIFYLSSLYFYVLFRTTGKTLFQYISVFLFSMALLTKEMAITLPGIIILYEIIYYKKDPFRRFRSIIPFVCTLSGYLLLRSLILKNNVTASVPFLHHVKAVVQIIGRYLSLLVLPVNQKVLYDISMESDLLSWKIAVSFLAILAFIVGGYHLAKRDPDISFCIGWFFITIFPVSGIPVILHPALLADRYLYLPSFGFALLTAYLIRWAATRLEQSGYEKKPLFPGRNQIWTTCGVALVVVLFATQTFQRNMIWSDNLTFFSHMVEDAPNAPLGHYNLGNEYLSRGDLVKAKQAWERAIALNAFYSDALNQLGSYYLSENSLVRAQEYYARAVAANPNNAEAHYNLANVLEALGDNEKASSQYRLFLRNVPIEHKPLIPEVEQRIHRLEKPTTSVPD